MHKRMGNGAHSLVHQLASGLVGPIFSQANSLCWTLSFGWPPVAQRRVRRSPQGPIFPSYQTSSGWKSKRLGRLAFLPLYQNRGRLLNQLMSNITLRYVTDWLDCHRAPLRQSYQNLNAIWMTFHVSKMYGGPWHIGPPLYTNAKWNSLNSRNGWDKGV